MEKPQIAAKKPKVLEMEPGTYWWCKCGRSKNQPFCDGWHQGTEFNPIKTIIEEKRTVNWCMCKHSGSKPFCDGTHRKL